MTAAMIERARKMRSVDLEPGRTPTSKVDTLHDGLAEVLRRHDVNAYAASVKAFALKPV